MKRDDTHVCGEETHLNVLFARATRHGDDDENECYVILELKGGFSKTDYHFLNKKLREGGKFLIKIISNSPRLSNHYETLYNF